MEPRKDRDRGRPQRNVTNEIVGRECQECGQLLPPDQHVCGVCGVEGRPLYEEIPGPEQREE